MTGVKEAGVAWSQVSGREQTTECVSDSSSPMRALSCALAIAPKIYACEPKAGCDERSWPGVSKVRGCMKEAVDHHSAEERSRRSGSG